MKVDRTMAIAAAAMLWRRVLVSKDPRESRTAAEHAQSARGLTRIARGRARRRDTLDTVDDTEKRDAELSSTDI